MRPNRKLSVRFASGFVLLIAGCANNPPPSTQPSSARDRQNQAMKDPFGYSPYGENPDISGGDIGHFDKKGFNRDVDHVLNP